MDTCKTHILVTGPHRSGTTWVGMTLSQHRSVSYIHEPFNVSFPNPEMGLALKTWFTHYQSSPQKDAIKSSFDNLFQASPMHRAIYTCRATGLDIKTPLRLAKYLVLYSIARRILVKDPIALFSAGWLHETYGLNVICTIRNPLAFVGSVKKVCWDFDFKYLQQQQLLMQSLLLPFTARIDKLCGPTGDFIDRACLLWNTLHYTILEYQQKYPSWLFVKYEDIAENPIVGFEKIFEYLKLDMSDRIRDYIQTFTSSENSAESTFDVYEPRNARKSLDNWKRRLSINDIERVRIATKDIASQFYEDYV